MLLFGRFAQAYPGQPIYARLWQGRGFFSPHDCNFLIDLNKLDWIVGSCILYPFQKYKNQEKCKYNLMESI